MRRRNGNADRLAEAAAFVVVACLAAGACTKNPYFIGALCPAADGGVLVDPRCATTTSSGVTLAADLDRSGASALSDDLELPTGAVPPALRLRGEKATAATWPADVGGTLGRGPGVPAPGQEAPFTDATRAVGLPADAPAYVAPSGAFGAVGGDDFAVEVVLRASVGASLFDKSAGAAGWSLRTTSGGALVLALEDASLQPAVEIASEPLVAGAWTHCLFWVSRAAGGRADCDGRVGTPIALGVLGDLDSSTAVTVGGGAATLVAHAALYRVPPGGLGDAGTWLAVGARRFASLTGARPRVAKGSALPLPGLRASPAYLDLQAAAGGPRHLFLVGPDWPRVSCRTDSAGTHDCGYLSEPQRTRALPAAPHAWQASELAVAPTQTPLADGAPPFESLVPSVVAAPHVLSLVKTFGPARQAFSFFARAAGSARVGAAVGNGGLAIFDLSAGTVVSAPAGGTAIVEPWGDGVFRCAVVVTTPMGPVTYAVHVLDALGAEPFAGDGTTASVSLAGLQLDIAAPYPRSLLAADPQAADQLTFVADDGNLPTGLAVSVKFRVLMPVGKRLTDQAVLNLNHGEAYEDQVQLFVVGATGADTGQMKFWGLRGGMPHWAFDHPTSLTDGTRHVVQAQWDTTSARVVIDTAPAQQAALIANTPAFLLDRIDVGFSTKSAGALEGLVAGLQIEAP